MLESQINTNKKLNIMVAGTSGCGKSTFCCGIVPRKGEFKKNDIYKEICPILYIDTEKGASSILKAQVRDLDPTVLTLRHVSTISQLSAIYDYIAKNKVYKTIIIDSIHRLQSHGLNKFSKYAKEISPEMLQATQYYHPMDYGKNLNQMKAVYELFYSLDVNLVTTVIADWHEKRDLDGSIVGTPQYRLALPEGQRKILPSYPDIVGLIELNYKGDRTFIVKQTDKYPFVKARGIESKINKATVSEDALFNMYKLYYSL